MTPEIETSTEAHKTGHKWIDISVAVCALVVSVTSLAVAVHHGKTMERMAEANARLVSANSWPMLQRFWSDQDDQGNRIVSLNVLNSGVGPAKIESVEMFWKNKPVRSATELLEACCLQGPEETARISNELATSSLRQTVLRAGENRRLFQLNETPANMAIAQRLRSSLTDLKTRACFCSVFDECWVTDLRTLHPEAVKECLQPSVQFVQ